MPLNIGLWRVDGVVQSVPSTAMPSEARLETLIEADPAILGQPLLLIGRQVTTSHGKRVDLLAIDGDGAIHVIELKKDMTPRDVIAQVLDYGSWAQGLTHEDVVSIYSAYAPERPLEVAFDDVFKIPLLDELNTGHWLTIVAGDIDPESQRIVEYLATYDLPVNVAFFRYFADEGREYLARTWLIEQAQEAGRSITGPHKSKEPWNNKDWYLSFGEEPNGRSWEDARTHGFVSAGGGDWYSRSLMQVPADARVWACIPKTGYVGVGIVTGPAQPFNDSPIDRANLIGNYEHIGGDEWVLPVEWLKTVPRNE
ncbi:MAG: hypothetical protein Q8L05_08880, partial [Actinomycetota bacterium]|nr:hypothetical protein [Actinomycetota bacterium]